MAIRTYGEIQYISDKKSWSLNKVEPHVCIKLKAIFQKLAIWASQPFIFPDTLEICNDLVWFLDRYPLAISEKDQKKLISGKKDYNALINERETILLPSYVPKKIELKEGFLARNYQLVGSDIHIKCKRILNGDDIGLGKTLTGILSCLQPGTLPCLVVMQTHMQVQWKSEIEKYTNLVVHIIKGTTPYNLPAADIYLMKYSCLAGWVDITATGLFKSAIFDEVQELRHDGSARYEGAKALSGNVEYCLGLSATPIYNYGDEIYNVLDVINPGCLGYRYDFLREWTGGGKQVFDPQALGTYLREQLFLLRRTRKDVGRELPPINKIVYTVGYDEDEVQKSEDIAKQLAIKVTTGCFMERGQAARELDILMRQTTGISKAKSVAEYVKILLENNEPIVLAGWHRAVYDIWLEELKQYNPVLYTGSESVAQKEAAKTAFITGQTNLFIMSLRSGVGLDGLQHRSNMVVFGELDWSPKVHDQFVGRLDRDGQQDPVTAIYLVSEYGSDPLIVDMLSIKSSQSHNILNPLTAVSQQYSDVSRIKILAERFLQKNK